MADLALKVAFKYVQKESKKTKVSRLSKVIREATGISKSKSEEIADAVVRSSRDLQVLARQKGWPLNDDGAIEGPTGSLTFEEIRRFL